ncbi:MAG TPA: MoaD/ThiS family protein [Candidatus Thermoplasmatota archaeon]|nr:MoaD/ThiS family protein [Candidatus Thermoplasmatota archaeon]
MPVRIRIPAALRAPAGGAPHVEVDARSVDEALARLVDRHGGLREHLFDAAGSLREHVNVYVNARDVRELSRGATPVADGDVVLLLPSVAGGAR